MKRTGILGTAALLLFGIAVPIHALQDQRDQEEKKPPETKPAPPEEKKPPQEDRHGREDKPAPREGKQDEARPRDERREQENKPTPQEDRRGREDKPVPSAVPGDERRGQPQQQRDQQDERRRQDARPPQQEQRRPEQDRRQVQDQRREGGTQDRGERQTAFREHRAKSWQSEHHRWHERGGYHGFRIPEDRFRASFGEDHSFRISNFSFRTVSGSPAFLCQGFWVVLVDPIPEFWGEDWYDTDDVYISWLDDGYYLFDRRYPSIAIAVTIST